MHYSGLELDRAGARRADAAWIAGLTARPGTRVVPLWRDQCLVQDGSPVERTGRMARALLEAAPEPVFLGLDGDQAVFAADLSELAEDEASALGAAEGVRDVRAMVSTLTLAEAGLLAYARGILHWHRNQRFCGACGGVAASRDGGHLRVCRGCGKMLFPRIEPAVIVLVECAQEPRRCLLGRHAGAGPDNFSTLAGFVEVGESLEDAVRREVLEEAGVVVKDVVYQGSQAWPFPAGLMVAFRAEAVGDETDVDGAELVEARWFTTAELRDHIDAGNGCRPDSIDKFLIESWIAERADDHTAQTTRAAARRALDGR
ncbi:NAD(+) diphosphatase [Streptomyces sp. WMMC940]|uniref:NAD(+) diphosphatase n=1 Tax=Streptomyces sp. WMMC940 TaxID=3015153 RepID=UPI0022B6A299|nr:NAD(+) diphosphatase [Streptomyces sp. WMMC940]MCZ7462277.1 NAD(+) diphosphatase [Streptomyces sp. WMMC940]